MEGELDSSIRNGRLDAISALSGKWVGTGEELFVIRGAVPIKVGILGRFERLLRREDSRSPFCIGYVAGEIFDDPGAEQINCFLIENGGGDRRHAAFGGRYPPKKRGMFQRAGNNHFVGQITQAVI